MSKVRLLKRIFCGYGSFPYKQGFDLLGSGVVPLRNSKMGRKTYAYML